jgi:hypothetical protein
MAGILRVIFVEALHDELGMIVILCKDNSLAQAVTNRGCSCSVVQACARSTSRASGIKTDRSQWRPERVGSQFGFIDGAKPAQTANE